MCKIITHTTRKIKLINFYSYAIIYKTSDLLKKLFRVLESGSEKMKGNIKKLNYIPILQVNTAVSMHLVILLATILINLWL